MTTHAPVRTPARSSGPVSGRPQRPAQRRTRRPADRNRTPRTNHQPADHSSAQSGLDAALTAAVARPVPNVTFVDLGLPSVLIQYLSGRGITTPFPIQSVSIPDALAGRDVLGRAQTGSGKTLAFGLPMLARLATSGTRAASTAPRGLVLVPTRELARQVTEELAGPASSLGMSVATVVGGLSIGTQADRLRRGVDVLVATPGRLIDHMERRSVRLDDVEIAVLDEADHMADLGFLPAVTRILDATPSDRQCLLFSATLDRGVDRLVRRYLDEPALHAVASATAPVEAMDHRVFRIQSGDKVAIAAEIAARPARTLFFVRTKHGADRLAKQLTQRGVTSAAIHGNLNQNQRLRALDAFTSGRVPVLVATDVAARGLHVDDLDLVVHYDPATTHKDYLHRSGRTARAGADGTALSFVEPHQNREVAAMHAQASVDPTIVNVQEGHPAVRELAESGEPITVTASKLDTPAGGSPQRRRNPKGNHRGQATGNSPRPRRRAR